MKVIAVNNIIYDASKVGTGDKTCPADAMVAVVTHGDAEEIAISLNTFKELAETLEGTAKALAKALDKLDPDSTDYEWIGHAHEVLLKAGFDRRLS